MGTLLLDGRDGVSIGTSEHQLTWRTQVIVRILFVIAGIFSPPEHAKEIQALANHINYGLGGLK